MANTGSTDRPRPTTCRPARPVSHPAPYNGGDDDDRKDLPMTALLTASLPEYLDDEPAHRSGPSSGWSRHRRPGASDCAPGWNRSIRRWSERRPPRHRVPIEVRRRRTLLAMMGLALVLLALPLGGFGGTSHSTGSALAASGRPGHLYGPGRRHPLVDRRTHEPERRPQADRLPAGGPDRLLLARPGRAAHPALTETERCRPPRARPRVCRPWSCRLRSTAGTRGAVASSPCVVPGAWPTTIGSWIRGWPRTVRPSAAAASAQAADTATRRSSGSTRSP